MLSAKLWPFCLSLSVLFHCDLVVIQSINIVLVPCSIITSVHVQYYLLADLGNTGSGNGMLHNDDTKPLPETVFEMILQQLGW